MRKMSTEQLRELEVINLCGGERLGFPCEFEFDVEGGCILGFTVRVCRGTSLFERKDEFVIPWRKIECIGEDAILVRLEREELSSCSCCDKKGRKRGLLG